MSIGKNRYALLFASIYITFVAFALFSNGGCGREGEPGDALKIGVVMDVGGRDDKGKNALVWRGCQRAIEEFDVDIDYREPASISESRESMEDLISGGAELLIVAAAPLAPIALEYAAENPGVDFLVVDGRESRENVLALSFPMEDAGYIAGSAAAVFYPGGTYAFIGGREDDQTKRLAAGFSRSVVEFTGDEPEAVFLGDDFDAPADTEKATTVAKRMYDGGVDVLFAAAGASNPDIFAVTLEKNRYAIGCESNQNWIERGCIFLSVSRRVDEIVYDVILAETAGRFEGGVRNYTIGDDVIEFPVDEENQAVYDRGVIGRIESTRSELAASEVPESP
jgi:basic membrane protein A